jgi:hypothetical protein
MVVVILDDSRLIVNGQQLSTGFISFQHRGGVANESRFRGMN